MASTGSSPYVRITGDIPGIADTPYDPPAEATPDAFQYTRSNDHFEAVMAYYHIDRSQRYVQQLDLGTAVLAAPIRVNPHGFGQQDNSQFYPSQKAIVFGDGGVDDAEDATVIWHEYMHALLEDAAPGLLGDNEGRALHEGWADYWAASYVRGLVEAGLMRRADWDFVFRWDSGDGTIWEGRHIASSAAIRKTRTATAKTRPAVPATSTRTGCSGRPCSWRFRTCSERPSPTGWRWRPRCI